MSRTGLVHLKTTVKKVKKWECFQWIEKVIPQLKQVIFSAVNHHSPQPTVLPLRKVHLHFSLWLLSPWPRPKSQYFTFTLFLNVVPVNSLVFLNPLAHTVTHPFRDSLGHLTVLLAVCLAEWNTVCNIAILLGQAFGELFYSTNFQIILLILIMFFGGRELRSGFHFIRKKKGKQRLPKGNVSLLSPLPTLSGRKKK